ncbi:unnamed protein product [Didymodactylos carnosus]|uniref:Uncharacterized protein n=2 Tax=Didymodactylos carnosus TaxID=1234261 RepID=A0A8S2R5K6_9BILA|nr:unnamed protein product [Didymodactylos carnosus]CAF4133028.1 unnamed protein product [Didymodactylos carnosus]
MLEHLKRKASDDSANDDGIDLKAIGKCRNKKKKASKENDSVSVGQADDYYGTITIYFLAEYTFISSAKEADIMDDNNYLYIMFYCNPEFHLQDDLFVDDGKTHSDIFKRHCAVVIALWQRVTSSRGKSVKDRHIPMYNVMFSPLMLQFIYNSRKKFTTHQLLPASVIKQYCLLHGLKLAERGHGSFAATFLSQAVNQLRATIEKYETAIVKNFSVFGGGTAAHDIFLNHEEYLYGLKYKRTKTKLAR